jgi:hypothetical protein
MFRLLHVPAHFAGFFVLKGLNGFGVSVMHFTVPSAFTIGECIHKKTNKIMQLHTHQEIRAQAVGAASLACAPACPRVNHRLSSTRRVWSPERKDP